MSCRTRQPLLFLIYLSLFSTATGQPSFPGHNSVPGHTPVPGHTSFPGHNSIPGHSTPNYSIVNYNSDNALPQNSINDMAFDKNGFLWLATEMGMVRFDGRNFREYNTSNCPALLSDRCALSFPQESSGKLLIEPIFATHRILTLTEDYQFREDSALSANPYQSHFRNNHMFSYRNLYRKWAAQDTAAFGGLFDKLDINGDLVTVNERQAYVRKGPNYYYLDENTSEVRPLPGLTGHALKIQFMVGDVYINIDRQNHLSAWQQGTPRKMAASSRLKRLLSEADVTGPYPIQAALSAARDVRHSFLIHKGDILMLYIKDGVLDFSTLAANTPIRNINCLIYDQQYKIIYAGTATSGLYILKEQEFERLYFSSDNYIINSLYAQVELPGDKILTPSGVLSRHSKINIPSPGIYDRPAFLRSSDGHIWYSSYGRLLRTDSDLHSTDSITMLGDITHVGVWITSIIETDNKDILCSTHTRLFRVRGKTATLLLDARPLLRNGEIIVIHPMSPDSIWVGTNTGLYSYDLRRGTFRHVPGMETATVRAIYKARDGSVWIGTYGQGFYKYDNARFLRMPADQDNDLATVHCFMEDRRGYFWMPTNKGLFRVAKNDLDSFASGGKNEVFYYYFDKSSGFATNEFNGGCTPCGIVTDDGHFSLPSLDGLIQFDPDSITIVPPNHPIFIDRLTMTNKKAPPHDYFELDQSAAPLVFAVSSPYYGNPANLHLEYSIKELDNRWHPLRSDGRLTLTGLRKGRYTLTIRKQEGYSWYSYSTLRWNILPYWYETILFRLITALLLISILPVIFWLRYTRQVKRGKQLEQKIEERTTALAESNRIKEKMISIILHDVRSPLRFLHMLAAHLYEKHPTTPPPVLNEMLLKFRNATHDLYEFAQDFVVWSNVQKEGFIVQQEKIALRETVAEIVSLYEPGADIRNNTVLNLVPGDFTLLSDPHILKLVIRNLTDNANKYTLSGEIRIEAARTGSATRVTITDTGRSMQQQLIDDILNNCHESDNDTHGFGYKIILELMSKIHGELSIDTPGSTGNRITLLFKDQIP
jgi:signal transduction histidine kinase